MTLDEIKQYSTSYYFMSKGLPYNKKPNEGADFNCYFEMNNGGWYCQEFDLHSNPKGKEYMMIIGEDGMWINSPDLWDD